MLQVLMEQWASCNGCWAQSELLFQIRQKKKHRQFGCRRWLTRSELLGKFGSTDVADQIIQAKLCDDEASKTHVRANPDCHGIDSPDAQFRFIPIVL